MTGRMAQYLLVAKLLNFASFPCCSVVKQITVKLLIMVAI